MGSEEENCNTNVAPTPTPLTLPPYPEMIMSAIEALDDDNGSDESAIAQQIESTYDNLPAEHLSSVTSWLREMNSSGQIIRVYNKNMESSQNCRPRYLRTQDMDLRYENVDCHCLRTANIQIMTGDENPECEGRLFYTCQTCGFFKWCNPVKVYWRGREIRLHGNDRKWELILDDDLGEVEGLVNISGSLKALRSATKFVGLLDVLLVLVLMLIAVVLLK